MTRPKAPTRGLVLGKFLPPHAGHLYMVDFACERADEVYVVVGTLAAEPIDGTQRFRWMQELCPRAKVLHLQDENPQAPSEHPDFWKIWRESLEAILPEPVDFVFASEPYGERLAKELGASFVAADLTRSVVPVSGTAIRADPFSNWRFIPPLVRPYFQTRVCVSGPESTGKTTLCERLAAHYDTRWVPEFAREYLEARKGDCKVEDMLPIARGQAALEDKLAPDAGDLLICDTSPVVTPLWSEFLFGEASDELEALARSRHYDLHLVLEPDVPWVADEVRYLRDQGEIFHQRYIDRLAGSGRKWVNIGGDWDTRFARACASIDALLAGQRRR